LICKLIGSSTLSQLPDSYIKSLILPFTIVPLVVVKFRSLGLLTVFRKGASSFVARGFSVEGLNIAFSTTGG